LILYNLKLNRTVQNNHEAISTCCAVAGHWNMVAYSNKSALHIHLGQPNFIIYNEIFSWAKQRKCVIDGNAVQNLESTCRLYPICTKTIYSINKHKIM